MSMPIETVEKLPVAELRKMVSKYGYVGTSQMRKQELLAIIFGRNDREFCEYLPKKKILGFAKRAKISSIKSKEDLCGEIRSSGFVIPSRSRSRSRSSSRRRSSSPRTIQQIIRSISRSRSHSKARRSRSKSPVRRGVSYISSSGSSIRRTPPKRKTVKRRVTKKAMRL